MTDNNTPDVSNEFSVQDTGYAKDLDSEVQDTLDSIGNPDVSYIYNKEVGKKKDEMSLIDSVDFVDSFSDLGLERQEKLSFYGEGVDVTDVYSTKLSDGSRYTRYDDFMKGADNEQRHADRQSTASKWGNGLSKFVGKTLTNTLGGTVGMGYGFVSMIGNWDAEKVYDNDFVNMLDDYSTKMDNFAANYRTQEERDMNFLEKANPFGGGFSNFIADDFLGGMSFLTGTVLSEGIWAAATGGASLGTTFGRMALRSAKAIKKANAFVKGGSKAATKIGRKLLRKEVKKYGVKESTKKLRKIEKLYATGKLTKEAARKAKNMAKAGESVNLLRFTYTSAGFESGMEARLYQREQQENFYKEFEKINGREIRTEDINDFEKNLDSTTNGLFLINMALVGASNFAMLGNTFGIKSPIKASNKYLSKKLYGTGVEKTVNKAGENVVKAITRNKAQRTLGFTKGLLAKPIMEGVVEEGGQATFSNAMEQYLTSRYNPNKEVIDMIEATYDGLAHTYGTKEGWNEVGLGMLIGFVGGEGASMMSRNKFLQEANDGFLKQDGRYYKIHKETGKKEEIKEDEYTKLKQDKTETYEIVTTGSVGVAENMNRNSGSNIVDKIFGSAIENNIGVATELQNANTLKEQSEESGDLNGIRSAETMIMTTSVQNAINNDYLEDQLEDFRTALELQAQAKEGEKSKLAEHYGIEQSEVSQQIDKMMGAYTQLADRVEKAQDFAEYMISDNPKELGEDMNPVDVQMAKNAVAYQMVMAEFYEDNMAEMHELYLDVLQKSNYSLYTKYRQSLKEYHRLRQVSPKIVQKKLETEKLLENEKSKLDKMNKQMSSSDRNSVVKSSELIQPIEKRVYELQEQLNIIEEEISAQVTTSKGYDQVNDRVRHLDLELEAIDPLADNVDGFIESTTVTNVLQDLEKLEEAVLKNNNPEGTQKLLMLTQQYHQAMDMWERNAKTLKDLADPKLGLKRVGHILTRKKKAGTTTLEFLKGLERTKKEEQDFAKKLRTTMATKSIVQEEDKRERRNNQKIVKEDKGQKTTEVSTKQTLHTIEQNRQKELDGLSKHNARLLSEEDVEKNRKKRLENPNIGDTVESINKEFNLILRLNKPKTKEVINEKYDKKISALYTKHTTIEANSLFEQLRDILKTKRPWLVSRSKNILENTDETKPTEEDISRYKELTDKFKSGDIRKIKGRPVDQIGKRVKERSGLTEEEIIEFQNLSRKFTDWELIVGTSVDNISIMDILEKIEFLKTKTNENVSISSEEQIAIAHQTEQSLGGKENYDIGQNFEYVKLHIDGEHMVLSHLVGNYGKNEKKDKNLIDKGFVKSDENVVVEQKQQQKSMQVYSKNINGVEYKVFVAPNNNVLIPLSYEAEVMSELGLDKVYYPNMRTAYGTVYQNGEAMKSGINIEDTALSPNEQGIVSLNSNEIYNLKPGDKLKFSFSLSNEYAQENEHILIEKGIALEKEGRKEEAQKLYDKAKDNMVIYIRTENGEVVQYLKAGRESREDSNFNKVREKAFNVLKETLENPFAQLENDGVVDVGLESTVKKFFIGSPNFVVEKGEVKNFPILEEQKNQIVKISYGNRTTAEKEGIRVAFLPKDKNVSYVVIEQLGSKIAYPVILRPDDNSVREYIEGIFKDRNLKSEVQKENALLKMLKTNGLDPKNYRLQYLEDNPQEIERVINDILNQNIFITKKTIEEAEGDKKKTEMLLRGATLTVNLEKQVAVSPKVVMNLDEDLVTTETGEKSKSSKMTLLEKQDAFVTQSVQAEIGLIERGLSKTLAEVELQKLAAKIGGLFQKEYFGDKKFEKLIYEMYKRGIETVPSIMTESMAESTIEEQVDMAEEGVPGDVKGELKESIEKLKQNPTRENIKEVAKKLINTIRDQFVVVPDVLKGKSDHLYHIPTNETDQEMFEKGFVKVYDNFYKKVQKEDRQTLVNNLLKRYRGNNTRVRTVMYEGRKYSVTKNFITNKIISISNEKGRLLTQGGSMYSSVEDVYDNNSPAYTMTDVREWFSAFVPSNAYEEVLYHFATGGTIHPSTVGEFHKDFNKTRNFISKKAPSVKQDGYIDVFFEESKHEGFKLQEGLEDFLGEGFENKTDIMNHLYETYSMEEDMSYTNDFIEEDKLLEEMTEEEQMEYLENNLPSNKKDYLVYKERIENLTEIELYQEVLGVNKSDLQRKVIKTFTGEKKDERRYLKEDFKRDFEKFIIKEMMHNSDLYREVLSQINTQGSSLIANNLSKETLDKFRNQLGEFYNGLLNYSLINKHINFGIESENVIFVEDVNQARRVDAVNNAENLPVIKGVNESKTKTKLITKQSDPFIQHEGHVYEKVNKNRQGKSVYVRLAVIDSDFLIGDVAPPFDNTVMESEAIEEAPTEVINQKGESIIDKNCNG